VGRSALVGTGEMRGGLFPKGKFSCPFKTSIIKRKKRCKRMEKNYKGFEHWNLMKKRMALGRERVFCRSKGDER